MTLDLAISRAVAQTRLLEAALHSDSPWFIKVGGIRALAIRVVHERGVKFTAIFTAVPVDSSDASLYIGDICRSVRPFTAPRGKFSLDWDLSLEEMARA